jgi:hypothetical protein
VALFSVEGWVNWGSDLGTPGVDGDAGMAAYCGREGARREL